MPRALPQPLRAEIVRRRQQGEPLAAIARALGLPPRRRLARTVRAAHA